MRDLLICAALPQKETISSASVISALNAFMALFCTPAGKITLVPSHLAQCGAAHLYVVVQLD
jgi:hypothetical protein